jgi:hypothetical protein
LDRNQAVRAQALQSLIGMGQASQDYARNRLKAGEDSARDTLNNSRDVTQAGVGTLQSTYASVLGQIMQQRAAAETGARADHEAQKQALLQRIAEINQQTAVQEAMANSGR